MINSTYEKINVVLVKAPLNSGSFYQELLLDTSVILDNVFPVNNFRNLNIGLELVCNGSYSQENVIENRQLSLDFGAVY